MEIRQLRPGLWRWTAPHPDWRPSLGPSPERPGGWAQYVGCVYCETPEGIALIDPLAPPEGTADAERFWRALDRDVARVGHSVAVLLTNDWHQRSAQALYDRYRQQVPVSIWA